MNGPEMTAALLARAWNERVATHGPDTDGARAEGIGLVVVCEGRAYDITVTPRDPGNYNMEVERRCGKRLCNDPAHLVIMERAGCKCCADYGDAHNNRPCIVCGHTREERRS